MKQHVLVGGIAFMAALALLLPLTAPSSAQAQASAKKSWEYKLLASYRGLVPTSSPPAWGAWVTSEDNVDVSGSFAENAARLGKQGWELVSVASLAKSGQYGTTEFTLNYYFKRAR